MNREMPENHERKNRSVEGAVPFRKGFIPGAPPSGKRLVPSLEQRTQELQDSLATISDRLKAQNRSMAELRRKIKEMAGHFGEIKARAYDSIESFGGAASLPRPFKRPAEPRPEPASATGSAHPAVEENLRRIAAKKRAAESKETPRTPAPPKAAPRDLPPLALAPMSKQADAGFITPALALLLVSAMAYGSASLQDSFTQGMKGISALRTSGTRPSARPKPARPRPAAKAGKRLAREPRNTMAYLPRRLPSVHRASPAHGDDRGLREALKMVYSFRPPGWRASVLDVLGNKGPEPLEADPAVERLDRDLYLVIFRTSGRGTAEQIYEFEADVVGQTVFARPATAQKLAYLPPRR